MTSSSVKETAIIEHMISRYGLMIVGLSILLLLTHCSDGGGIGDTSDDHGNITACATLANLAPESNNPPFIIASLSGVLERRGDIDVFRIELPQDQTLVVTSTGSTDTVGGLFNQMDEEIETVDDNTGLNFSISRLLRAGVYFIKVTGFKDFARGVYMLSVRARPDDHPDQTNEAVDAVPFDTPIMGNLEVEGDVDLFRIELIHDGTLRLPMSDFPSGSGTQLLDINGNDLAIESTIDVSQNAVITASLPAGAYFVEAREVSTEMHPFMGAISYQFAANVIPDNPDSIGRAVDVVPFDTPILGGLEVEGDIDVFRIELINDNKLRVGTSGNTPTSGRLFDMNQNEIRTVELVEVDQNFVMIASLPAGTYFVEVQGLDITNTGPYQFAASVRPLDDHPDSISLAVDAVPLDTPIAGNLEMDDDIDIFRIELIRADKLRVGTMGITPTSGRLLDALGNEISLGVFVDDGPDASLIVAFLTPGTYFVEVTGRFGATGPYQFTANVINEPDDHPDTIGQIVKTIPFDTPISGNLEVAGDVDVFRIELINAGKLQVGTSGSTDTRGRLIDQSGNVILTNDDRGDDNNFRLTAPLLAGTYFVEVSGFSGIAGPYQLTSSIIPPDDHPDLVSQAVETTPLIIPIAGNLEVEGDIDVFRIELTQPGKLQVGTSGNTDTSGTLIDLSGREFGANFSTDGNFVILISLSAGIYFVEVTGFNGDTGTYQFTARVVPDDHPDTIDLAVEAARFDTPIEGDLEVEGDVDVFRIELINAGILTVGTTGGTRTFGRLLDPFGNVILEDSFSGDNGNFRLIEPLLAGIYFVEVSAFNDITGPYQLTASVDR